MTAVWVWCGVGDYRGGRANRTFAYGSGSTAMWSIVAKVTVAPPSCGVCRGWYWKAAGDGDDLETSRVAYDQACF